MKVFVMKRIGYFFKRFIFYINDNKILFNKPLENKIYQLQLAQFY